MILHRPSFCLVYPPPLISLSISLFLVADFISLELSRCSLLWLNKVTFLFNFFPSRFWKISYNTRIVYSIKPKRYRVLFIMTFENDWTEKTLWKDLASRWCTFHVHSADLESLREIVIMELIVWLLFEINLGKTENEQVKTTQRLLADNQSQILNLESLLPVPRWCHGASR